jgi:hypothetical protein
MSNKMGSRMGNNSAILNCVSKELYIRFIDKFFIVDLKEGDLEDNWNTILFSENTMLDVNLDWDFNSDFPTLCLYGLTYNAEKEVYETNTDEAYPISIVNIFGSKALYFGEDYKANIGINVYRVYSKSEMIKRTTSLSQASDLGAKLMISDKMPDIHITVTDKNGASKVVEIEHKYIQNYQIKEKAKLVDKHFGMSKMEKLDHRIKYRLK